MGLLWILLTVSSLLLALGCGRQEPAPVAERKLEPVVPAAAPGPNLTQTPDVGKLEAFRVLEGKEM